MFLKCYQNNTFSETIIQRLLDGLISVKKGIGMHVQRILRMRRCLYTGGNFKPICLKIWDLIYDHGLTN